MIQPEGRPVVAVVARDADWLVEQLRQSAPQIQLVSGAEEADFGDDLERVEALLLWEYASTIVQRLWPRLPNLRWVQVAAAGVDALVFPALVESDVALTNARGLYSDAIAEFALALILAHAKRLPDYWSQQRQGVWRSLESHDLLDRTLGIVGFGHIGRAVARRARPFGMRVIGLRSTASAGDQDADEVLGRDRLDDLLAASDYVALTLPLTAGTRGLIGAPELALMRPSAVLINLGRGGLVDEAALDQALRAGRLAGAAFDVFAEEPLPLSSPLWDAPNFVVTPHVAGDAERWRQTTVALFLENLQRFVKGEPLENLVDKARGY
ncbi:MAG: D-2-hydroxyacid dehydrogenase [Chloroflexi bacterium]|nr:D-2-hydroxyacid dehydrogenase [Chloroflexota bacterium]